MTRPETIIHHLPALEREDREQTRRSIAMTEEQAIPESTTENTEKKPRRGPPKKANPMRSNTFTTYMTVEVLERLSARCAEAKGETKNARLQADLTTYWNMLDISLAYAKRDLTQSEAKAILDVLNGTYWDATNVGMMTGGGLTLEVSDAVTLNGLDKKWGLDAPTFLAKLEKMDRMTTLALMDWARLFWANHQNIDLDAHVNDFQPDQ